MSKRMVSLFLSAVMFVVYSFGATATYAAENIETAIIDGKEYRCESRIVDDKEYMYITNITDEITDVVYYDVCSGRRLESCDQDAGCRIPMMRGYIV